MTDWAALFVGIDNYPFGQELNFATRDAIRLSEAFGFSKLPPNSLYLSPTPDVDDISEDRLYKRESEITFDRLKMSIRSLMQADHDYILFYFSGHADIDWEVGAGFLQTPDRCDLGDGVPFSYLMQHAKRAANKNKKVFIILDACKSGAMGEVEGGNSSLPKNITIMAAAREFEPAIEKAGIGGVFTDLLIQGLKGSAADQAGRISAPSLYTYVDTMLTNFGQRPVFKTNITKMVTLKDVEPRVPLSTLKNIVNVFETEDTQINLGPEFDPTPRNELPEKYRLTSPDDKKVKIYEQMRHLNRNGMLVPVGVNHLYDAAFQSKPVELTELGKMYHKLSKLKRLD